MARSNGTTSVPGHEAIHTLVIIHCTQVRMCLRPFHWLVTTWELSSISGHTKTHELHFFWDAIVDSWSGIAENKSSPGKSHALDYSYGFFKSSDFRNLSHRYITHYVGLKDPHLHTLTYSIFSKWANIWCHTQIT